MRDHVVQVALVHVSLIMFSSAVFFSFWLYFLLAYEAISITQTVGYYILITICGINLFVIGPVTVRILKTESGDPWLLRWILIAHGLLCLLSTLPTPLLSNVFSQGEVTRQYIHDFYMAHNRPPYLVDYIHRAKHCCGHTSYTDFFKDYKDSRADDDGPLLEPVPPSCCLKLLPGCERSSYLIYKVGCFVAPDTKSELSVWENPYHGTGFFPVLLLPLIMPLLHLLLFCFLHDGFVSIQEIQERQRKDEEEDGDVIAKGSVDEGGDGDVNQPAESQSSESNSDDNSESSTETLHSTVNKSELVVQLTKRNAKTNSNKKAAKKKKNRKKLKDTFKQFASMFKKHEEKQEKKDDQQGPQQHQHHSEGDKKSVKSADRSSIHPRSQAHSHRVKISTYATVGRAGDQRQYETLDKRVKEVLLQQSIGPSGAPVPSTIPPIIPTNPQSIHHGENHHHGGTGPVGEVHMASVHQAPIHQPPITQAPIHQDLGSHDAGLHHHHEEHHSHHGDHHHEDHHSHHGDHHSHHHHGEHHHDHHGEHHHDHHGEHHHDHHGEHHHDHHGDHHHHGEHHGEHHQPHGDHHHHGEHHHPHGDHHHDHHGDHHHHGEHHDHHGDHHHHGEHHHHGHPHHLDHHHHGGHHPGGHHHQGHHH